MYGIMGEKAGMTAVYANGEQIPVTVIKTQGNRVVGKRTVERDGYDALILGFGERSVKALNKPELGFFEKNALVEANEAGKKRVKRFIREVRMSAADVAKYEVGQTVDVTSLFKTGQIVDVVGKSKGRGFTGVMKRHHFAGSKASHGVHEYFRHGGAISSNTYPAHVFKNKKMPGQMGASRVSVLNIKVVDILADEGLILVRGGVPGPVGGLVFIRGAIKRRHG